MFVLRPTKKLMQKMGVHPDSSPGTSTTVTGDWFANILHTRKGRYVLAISSVSLLPVVVHGRDLPSLPQRIADTAAEVLGELGVPNHAIERERSAMDQVAFAGTNDRSTLGVLNDLMFQLTCYLEQGHPTDRLVTLSFRLSETPIVARDLFPDHRTREIFGLPGRQRVRCDLLN